MNFYILFSVLFVAAGSWLISRVFGQKGRDPVTGAIIGAVAGLYWVVLVIVLVIALLLPRKGEGFSLPSLPKRDGDSNTKKLEALQQMKEDGLITQAELKTKKDAILAQI